MDKRIDSRFERLEKALSSLVDSVTKYHPSVAQAEELQAADAQLSLGLEEVQVHQNNHLLIQQLRRTSSALDAQIRDTLTSLASTRKDIVSTQITKFSSEPNHPISYDELLAYARRISKTTLPPAATILTASPSPETQTPAAGGATSEPQPQPSSAVTPSARTPSRTESPVANGTLPQPTNPDPPAQQNSASQNTSLPEGMSQYLNPLSGQVFFPWPLEDKIRSGALASYQILVEQGIDPRGYDPATEEERRRKEEDERKAKEEREKAEREDRERQLREERERLRVERERQREKEQEAWRKTSIATGMPGAAMPARAASGTGEKKQFQFTNLDDLDDDDDDEG
ncbi:Mediator of RNA polymerase II transcription subunit 4 [Ophiocordyceps camponoti-floridani]|uniref:Mediator of RNA polymerase II transcription subunit 4 n=1 Tax=Ophiocordyceps camponoti-floridani TaxID=2030778 RepID=A0A8H4QBC4_9HYPO|nr:Mediator of RNA polymerase II transcription subunit 4 [Ophiocordyceps camponoti-floridani]